MRIPVVPVVALLAACPDPVGEAPRATVAPSAAPSRAPETAPAAPAAPPPSATPVPAGATRFVFDAAGGSTIGFTGAKVTKKHDGGFRRFAGVVDVSGKTARIDVDIDVTSIFTDSAKLDAHLLKPDFFDAARFPRARFTSTKVDAKDDGTATITGDLAMRGVTKTITFPAKVAVQGDTATADAEFGINRKDWGISYAGKADDLVMDEVLLKLHVVAKRTPSS